MSASRLRGDEDLFEILNDLSSAQGYEDRAAVQERGMVCSAHSRQTKRQRLSLSTGIDGFSIKPAGNQSIWNPHVHVENFSPCYTRCLAPTNPTVEVFRRRAFERFKKKMKDIFEFAASSSTKLDAANLWRELQVVSLAERWYFAAKLEEMQKMTRKQRLEELNSILDRTTYEVHDLIRNASAQQECWVDPILISVPIVQTSKNSNAPQENAILDEIKFEWLRAWRRTNRTKERDDEVTPVFESKKFKKKSTGVLNGVNSLGIEVMAVFRKELSKRAQDEALLTATMRQRRHGPKVTHTSDQVSITFSGMTFSINRQHFDKVEILFERQNQACQSEKERQAKFFSSLFCLLARYDTIQGAGLQAALQGAVFDVLLMQYGCSLECFASPLNCRYERYFSAFPDTDSPFGSLGSFFDYDFAHGGAYQANPPFVAAFIHAMCQKMEESLQSCDKPLMFIVFIPAWTETDGWTALKESPYLQHYMLVDQSSHCFTEGTQHRRKVSKRTASFDTSIFFLQNEAGRGKWEINDRRLAELKLAFDPAIVD